MEPIVTYRELSSAREAAGDPIADLLGREALDRSGERVGDVTGLVIDERERRVRFLRIGADPLLAAAERQFLVPVEAIARVEIDRVHLDHLREHIYSAPIYDPADTHPPEYFAGILGYYGCSSMDVTAGHPENLQDS